MSRSLPATSLYVLAPRTNDESIRRRKDVSPTFQNSPKYMWTSESVTEGHPDKVCDQLSDAILDWCLSQTPEARVACEASVKSDNDNDYVWIYGEVTPLPPKEVVEMLVRRTLSDIGYTDRAFGT